MIVAVLDSDVLFPMLLRDTLLRASNAGCFRIHWSTRILDEVTRNLVDDYGMDAARAADLRELMCDAFPEAMVEDWEALVPRMGNHPKDRHVAAVAAKVEASIIVTSNVRDFRGLPDGIATMSPDAFLRLLLERGTERLRTSLVAQAAGCQRPRMSVAGLLERLAPIAPNFVSRLQSAEDNS